MGLCACRRSTPYYCFEHKHNVCEECTLTEHAKCIIHLYTRWLSNGEYVHECGLCKKSLDTAETLRLICYDLFHKACLDRYVSGFADAAVLDRLVCPSCQEVQIMPPVSAKGMLVDRLRNQLQAFPWARSAVRSLPPAASSAASLGPSVTAPDLKISIPMDRLDAGAADRPLIGAHKMSFMHQPSRRSWLGACGRSLRELFRIRLVTGFPNVKKILFLFLVFCLALTLLLRTLFFSPGVAIPPPEYEPVLPPPPTDAHPGSIGAGAAAGAGSSPAASVPPPALPQVDLEALQRALGEQRARGEQRVAAAPASGPGAAAAEPPSAGVL